MKITFIGTSHGVPAADRFCSSVMVEVGDAVYLIDAGAPVSSELLRYGKSIKQLRAVFTTHAHGDHTVGLFQLCDLMNWYYTDSAADFFITEQPLIDVIKSAIIATGTPTIDESRLRFRLAADGFVYADEHISVSYLPTEHTKDSHAVLVTDSETGARVLFGGDFSQGLQKADVPDVIREPIDAFVCEMAHFGAAHIEPYLAECRAKQVIFTHVFPLTKYADIEALKGKYSFPILTPADGDAYVI